MVVFIRSRSGGKINRCFVFCVCWVWLFTLDESSTLFLIFRFLFYFLEPDAGVVIVVGFLE